jgi:hypothetical protein
MEKLLIYAENTLQLRMLRSKAYKLDCVILTPLANFIGQRTKSKQKRISFLLMCARSSLKRASEDKQTQKIDSVKDAAKVAALFQE